MKTIKFALVALAGSLAVSCSDLDLSPRDKAASGSWYQTPEQFELNLNALLHHTYWPMERNEWTSGEQTELDMLTDDGQNRSAPGRFLIDGVNSDFPLSVRMWDITYTGINRCNKIITEMCVLEVTENGLVMTEINPEFTVEQVKAATAAPITVAENLKSMID